eukprot:Rmarinus@m.17585
MIDPFEIPFFISFLVSSATCLLHYYLFYFRKVDVNNSKTAKGRKVPISTLIIHHMVVGSWISALGNVPSIFIKLNEHDGWCKWEAFLTSLGDNLVVGWTFFLALFVIICVYDYFRTFYNRVLSVMKIFCWGFSLILAVIPFFDDAYGIDVSIDEEEVDYCWIKDDERGWMWIQFYGPLLFVQFSCLVALFMIISRVFLAIQDMNVSFTKSIIRKRKRFLYRMGLQLLYLIFLWGFDTVGFIMGDKSGET